MRLFGDTDPISRPLSDPEQLTRRDRKLIGEFVRRNHPRLAHEIARFGFPTRGEPLHVISSHLQKELADLTGFVARSHGLSLRSCLPFLEKHFHLREYQGVHAVYLMVLLRIADYLQVQSERAPEERLQVVDIKSPISQGEWRAHRAIKNITFEGPDPESLDIKAVPLDVRTFLRLQDLLAGLQKELDLSWAVLGEVYGRHERLSGLALELRRVRSNLDDVNTFANLVSYIPVRARFESVDADLLSLLVEPLYGKDVNIGVRELIQNAVDACRELRDYSGHTEHPLPDSAEGPDVTVVLTGDEASGYRLTTTDHGIGMTADVIRNYYLKAGASYRRSDAWRRMYESEPGRSRVLRSGRFGIGVLAAFLLGDEIEVTTRHIAASEGEGVHFRASLESEAIEMERCTAPVGTSISIKLRADAAKSLIKVVGQWKWSRRFGELPEGVYLLDSPSVDIRLPEHSSYERIAWPAAGADLPPEWHRINAEGYEDVQWSYGSGEPPIWAALACNGIAVGYLTFGHELWREGVGIGFSNPSISVFDPNGTFPLVLTRTALATPRLPFQDELAADICRDIIAFCLTDEAPVTWHAKAMGPIAAVVPSCRHPALRSQYSTRAHLPYVMMSEGFALRLPGIISSLNISSLVVASRTAIECPVPDSGWAITMWDVESLGLTSCDSYVRSCLLHEKEAQDSLALSKILGVRVRIPNVVSSRWPNQTIVKTLLKRARREFDDKGVTTLVTKGFQPFDFPFTVPRDSKIWALAEYSLDPPVAGSMLLSSVISRTFIDLLGTHLIPYDLSERRRQFARAFDELKDYISRREALAKKKH